MPQQIVFMGGKEIGYHCLMHLLDEQHKLNVEVVAVLAGGRMLFEPDLSIKELCSQRSVPFLESLDEYLQLPDFDLLVSVQYHEILKPVHINKAELAVNLHMAPLPEYRGCNQFSFAIIDGATSFGTTIHQLEPSIDGGAILFEKRFPMPENCVVTELYEVTYQHSLDLFRSSLALLVNGLYEAVPQADLVAERGTSFHLRNEMDGLKQLDPDWPQEKIDRYVRATYFPPFEAPWFLVDGKKVYLSPDRLKRE